MIIGLTGTIAAGKGEIAEYLKDRGFEYYSYSDVIRQEAKKRGYKETRVELQKLGDEIRKEYGDEGALSKIILSKIKTDKAVVDGIRNSNETRALREVKGFYLIGVDAPQKLRFQRLKDRKRLGDPKTFDEFKKIDDKENKGLGGQEIKKCLYMADFKIINNGGLEELRKKVDKVIENIRS